MKFPLKGGENKGESYPQVPMFHVLVGLQPGRESRIHDLPLAHHVNPVGQSQCHRTDSSYSADRASPETAFSSPAAASVDLAVLDPSRPRTRDQSETVVGITPRGILRNRTMIRIP